jgi:folylpolyglutamate synthase/dihydropteroate synthase
VPELAVALARATASAAAGDLCVVAGSIYLVGEARELLLGEVADSLPVGDPLETVFAAAR